MPDFPNVIDLASLGSAGWTLFGGTDQERAGNSVSSAGDVNGDGLEDFIVGTNAGASAENRTYVIYGKVSGFTTIKNLSTITAADGFIISGDVAGDQAGISVSSAGDLNGDGIDDIIVGANLGDNGGADAGEAYVIFGKTGTRANIDLTSPLGTNGFIIQGDLAGDQAGFSVSRAGDFNGDGFDDIIVGARYADNGAIGDTGKAYLIFGHAGAFGNIDLTSLGSAGVVFRGQAQADLAGWSVSSAGDINGDGKDDLLIGAKGTDNSPTAFELGTVYVVFGKASPASTIDLASLGAADGFTIRGEPYDKAGWSVASAGDVNGDGFADIILGVPYNDDGGSPSSSGGTGSAYVLFGKASGFGNINLANPLAAADGFQIIGDLDNDFAAGSVAGGDVNGDGFDDIIVGAQNGEVAGDYSTGEVYVIFGKASGFSTINLATPLADPVGFTIQGAENSNKAGFSVSAGDINGDGFADVIVGAPQVSSVDAGPPQVFHVMDGAAYVVFGRAPTTGVTRIGAGGGQTIRGGDFADTLSGLGGNDSLYGGGGIDNLNGGTGADYLNGGAAGDAMAGNEGDDVYIVDNAGDIVTEAASQGRDVVYATVSWALSAGSEVEVISTASLGGVDAINLTGNALAQEIDGNAGANFLNGGGGADVLVGFGGDDQYFITSGTETIVEGAGGGRDVAYTIASHVLAAGIHLEVLSTTSIAGTAAINLTGNAFVQEIDGNNGNNILNGGGGADVLVGFGGNDQYFITTGSETIVEAAGGGTDVAYTVVSHVLAAGIHVEVLSTTSIAGTSAINLTGNAFVQEIDGNNGANILNGGGGADALVGYGGDDTYFLSDGGESVIEAAGGGRDVVYTSASHTLRAGSSVEVLSVASLGGTAAIHLVGNELAQELYGNAGGNILNGGGGADYLVGGAGGDFFDFTTALGGGNIDTIVDMAAGTDKIRLDDAIFAGIGTPGSFNANAFFAGAVAHDADDRIIYNSATGALLYDADGNGAGTAIQFAILQTGLALGASDFAVI